MPAVPDPRVLGELDLFRGLSAAELARVNDALGRTRFASGAAVLTATQPGEVAYIVLSGDAQGQHRPTERAGADAGAARSRRDPGRTGAGRPRRRWPTSSRWNRRRCFGWTGRPSAGCGARSRRSPRT